MVAALVDLGVAWKPAGTQELAALAHLPTLLSCSTHHVERLLLGVAAVHGQVAGVHTPLLILLDAHLQFRSSGVVVAEAYVVESYDVE